MASWTTIKAASGTCEKHSMLVEMVCIGAVPAQLTSQHLATHDAHQLSLHQCTKGKRKGMYMRMPDWTYLSVPCVSQRLNSASLYASRFHMLTSAFYYHEIALQLWVTPQDLQARLQSHQATHQSSGMLYREASFQAGTVPVSTLPETSMEVMSGMELLPPQLGGRLPASLLAARFRVCSAGHCPGSPQVTGRLPLSAFADASACARCPSCDHCGGSVPGMHRGFSVAQRTALVGQPHVLLCAVSAA